MNNYNENWLPNLKDSIPREALGMALTMYTIALEGWRRGLILKFKQIYYKKEKKMRIGYSLTYKGKTHHFIASRGDKVSKEAIKICNNKSLTREFLVKAGVNSPTGRGFNSKTDDKDIIKFANELGYPVVLKPTNGLQGKGVVLNIKDETEFKRALKYVKHNLGYRNLIVEKFIEGEDCRVYIIDGKVVAAVTRTPANVVGDGTHSIEELIEVKNKKRNKNPNHYLRPIRIDEELNICLQEQNYTLKSVPNKDTKIYLKKTSNISTGGDSVDITENLTDEMKNTAINAAAAIPDLNQCAVDMLIDKKNNEASIIEVNSKPLIGLHLFPSSGLARDVPKEIIDYYFPETKGTRINSPFFFDFGGIVKLLRSGSVKEVKVKKIPQYSPIAKKITLTGEIKQNNFRNWVKRKARSLQLNGFTKNSKNGTILVVVAGKNESITEFEEGLEKKLSNNVDIYGESWDQPIRMGFYSR